MKREMVDHYARICGAVDQVMARYREPLTAVGLRLQFRGIIESEEGLPEAEARLGVYEGDRWIDSIEFSVWRDGKPTVSPNEVEAWLISELDRLVGEHPWGGGWEEV